MKPFIKIAALALPLLLAVVTLRPSSEPTPAKNPLGSLVQGALGAVPIRGRVEERLPAGSYTYLRLRSENDALLWAVTLGQGAPAGARVALRSMGHSTNFHSRRLQRTFPELVFGIVSRLD